MFLEIFLYILSGIIFFIYFGYLCFWLLYVENRFFPLMKNFINDKIFLLKIIIWNVALKKNWFINLILIFLFLIFLNLKINPDGTENQLITSLIGVLGSVLASFNLIDGYKQYQQEIRWYKVKRFYYKKLFELVDNIVQNSGCIFIQKHEVEGFVIISQQDNITGREGASIGLDLDKSLDNKIKDFQEIIDLIEQKIQQTNNILISQINELNNLFSQIEQLKNNCQNDFDEIRQYIIPKIESLSSNDIVIAKIILLKEYIDQFIQQTNKLKTYQNKSAHYCCQILKLLKKMLEIEKSLFILVKNDLFQHDKQSYIPSNELYLE